MCNLPILRMRKIYPHHTSYNSLLSHWISVQRDRQYRMLPLHHCTCQPHNPSISSVQQRHCIDQQGISYTRMQFLRRKFPRDSLSTTKHLRRSTCQHHTRRRLRLHGHSDQPRTVRNLQSPQEMSDHWDTQCIHCYRYPTRSCLRGNRCRQWPQSRLL